MTIIPRMAGSLIDRAGGRFVKAASCASRSGDVLNSTQSTPFPLTAIEDWVLGFALINPFLTP